MLSSTRVEKSRSIERKLMRSLSPRESRIFGFAPAIFDSDCARIRLRRSPFYQAYSNTNRMATARDGNRRLFMVQLFCSSSSGSTTQTERRPLAVSRTKQTVLVRDENEVHKLFIEKKSMISRFRSVYLISQRRLGHCETYADTKRFESPLISHLRKRKGNHLASLTLSVSGRQQSPFVIVDFI